MIETLELIGNMAGEIVDSAEEAGDRRRHDFEEFMERLAEDPYYDPGELRARL
jgi:hypothetical protein